MSYPHGFSHSSMLNPIPSVVVESPFVWDWHSRPAGFAVGVSLRTDHGRGGRE